MADASKEKMKLLLIMQMMQQETDAQQGLTMAQIIQRLNGQGISAERKSVYRDIQALRQIGFDIQVFHRAPAQYGLASRTFSVSELSLMVDAVQSSRFLSKRKAGALVSKIKTLASMSQRKELDKAMHVEGRIASQEESALGNVDVVQQAMTRKRKISFRYCDYDVNLKRVPRKDQKRYVETPVRLVYSENNYYLLAYNQAHERMVTYRVDRMASLRVLDEPAARNQAIATFDAERFANRTFSMYGGKTVSAKLTVDVRLMNQMVDRFGTDLAVHDLGQGKASLSVQVMDSPTLYGWLAQFGSQVRVESPQSLAQGYAAHLRAISALYD